ncbi:MAG: sugar phosphate nucleotidyltransferase [Pseudomonadales bacterium]
MKALILSAGQGKRLLPLTADRPKSSLHAGSRSLLEWQLHELKKTAITEVVVITGFNAGVLEAIVAGIAKPATRTLYNPFFSNCDNLGTCWIAREEMHEPFLLINGDTLFEAAIVEQLLAQSGRFPITLATDRKTDYDDDDMKVVVADDQLHRVGKQLGDAPVNGESIGMMVFRQQGPTLFRNKLDQLMRDGSGLGRWYLSAIDELAQDDQVGSCCIESLQWCEVDDASDLAHAVTVVGGWTQ